MDDGKTTAPGLVRVFSVNMCYSITGWCWVIFDHWGSSDLTHVSVRARRDRSLSAIRPWSSGALLTTDLVFSEPNVRLTDYHMYNYFMYQFKHLVANFVNKLTYLLTY